MNRPKKPRQVPRPVFRLTDRQVRRQELAVPRGQGIPRVGHGYDLHRLEPRKRLVLGGVVVSEDFGPVAHSDGDVVIHALVDAMLGAMAWGDIGEAFPDTDPQWRDAESRIFLEQTYAAVQDAGYRLANADITLLLEKPKIASFKPRIVENLRQLTVNHGTINLKAGTNEGADAVGRGEAVAAHAVVLLARE